MSNSLQQGWLVALLSVTAAVSLPAGASIKTTFRKAIKIKKDKATTPATQGPTDYDGLHADVLNTALKTHEDYVAESAGKIAFTASEMKNAVAYVLEKFGPVVVASYQNGSASHGNHEAWSVTFRKRPARTGPLGKLVSAIPNGWGLFFDHREKAGWGHTLDLTLSSELSTFLRNHPHVAEKISDDATVNALFAFVGGKGESSSAPAEPHSTSGAVLNDALAERARQRVREIDTKYAEMMASLDGMTDLASIAQEGRIIVHGLWQNARDIAIEQEDRKELYTHGSFSRQRETAFNKKQEERRQREIDAGPKVVYFFPEVESDLLSGFRAHHLDETFKLNDHKDRYRFAALFPDVFNQLDALVINKYERIKKAENDFADKIAQLKNTETGQTMRMLGHPAIMVILKSRLPDSYGRITVGKWTPKGQDRVTTLELSTIGVEPNLHPSLAQINGRARHLTSRFPQNEEELATFEEDEKEMGPVPPGLLRDFVNEHNEKVKREALHTNYLENEDARSH